MTRRQRLKKANFKAKSSRLITKFDLLEVFMIFLKKLWILSLLFTASHLDASLAHLPSSIAQNISLCAKLMQHQLASDIAEKNEYNYVLSERLDGVFKSFEKLSSKLAWATIIDGGELSFLEAQTAFSHLFSAFHTAESPTGIKDSMTRLKLLYEKLELMAQ
jgi:hypothetical protein